jgi:hypothetical protein
MSVLLFALSANFYINGFVIQAALTALVAVALIILMIRNIRCTQNLCGLSKKNSKKEKIEDACDKA